MIILTKRQIKITNFLENKLEWTTIENIAKAFDVSERTIRNDLDSIGLFLQENNIELERKPRLGVKINLKRNQNINNILKECTNKLYTADDRVIMIAIILLIRSSTTIEKLSDYIQVSKNTLVNDLKASEEILKSLGVEVTKKSYYGITTKENNYEKLANAFLVLFHKLEERYEYEVYKLLYENNSLDKKIIRNIIEAVEENKGIQYTEEAYEELEIILLLTIYKSINSKSEDENYKSNLLTKESIFLKEIIEKFSQVKVNDERISYLFKVFKGAKRSKYITENKQELDVVVNEIVEELCEILNIKVDNDNEFLMQMAMHLNVAIYRLKNNWIINNPMLEEIKYKMSFIYDVTEKVLNNKKDVIGVEFPDAKKCPGVDICTGSLGQGFSNACGIALGNKLNNYNSKTYVVLGDGELQEGIVWEAMMAAAKYNLDNLVAIVDKNNIQLDGRVSDIMLLDNLENRISDFGWHVVQCDGHDFDDINRAFNEIEEVKDKPKCIIANTIKGKGVSFMEDNVAWHGVAPNKEQTEMAIAEIVG